MRLAHEQDAAQQEALVALERAGHPVVRIILGDRYHIGQEFFRWEFATAVAGAVIGINPFDPPDVAASKGKTRALTTAFEKTRAFPPGIPIRPDSGVQLFGDGLYAHALVGV